MGLTNRDKTPKDPDPEPPPPDPGPGLSDEQLALHRWRYREARRMGFTWREAKLFASSRMDIEEMRELALRGCRPDLILRVLCPLD